MKFSVGLKNYKSGADIKIDKLGWRQKINFKKAMHWISYWIKWNMGSHKMALEKDYLFWNLDFSLFKLSFTFFIQNEDNNSFQLFWVYVRICL
jgi:hypothetical protein